MLYKKIFTANIDILTQFGDVGKWSSPGGGAKSYRNDLISINW
jgi:hypothetical protein